MKVEKTSRTKYDGNLAAGQFNDRCSASPNYGGAVIGPIAAGVPETWQVRTPEMPAFFSNLNSKAVSVSLFMRETSPRAL